MSSNIPFGNVRGMAAVAVALSPSAVAANTVAEQTFTVSGILATDFVEISKPTTQAGLGIANVRVSAKDTIAIAFVNATGSPITPTAAEVYQLMVFRPDGTPTARASM
ncbi:hypothetical protein PQQ63_15340 [Paraburkholderia metrosideri]|uniref:Uncharacterized protein n=1 Tax=Paraburkholderia metrosideri TaxID=580937 RepID=A0ABW9DSJ9_9BURK